MDFARNPRTVSLKHGKRGDQCTWGRLQKPVYREQWSDRVLRIAHKKQVNCKELADMIIGLQGLKN